MSSVPPDGGDGNDNDDENGNRKRGHRKDSRPFKEGNTRPDGDYAVGKYRPPETGKFRANDGRARGKRGRGSKNVATVWRKSLSRKHTINGVTRTAAEWLVESMIRRGISKSDRAAEKALDAAERFERAADPKLGLNDHEIMAAWMREFGGVADGGVSDDADHPENGDGSSMGDEQDDRDVEGGDDEDC